MESFERNSFKLRHPFAMVVAGIAQSGKTEFVKKILLNPEKIIDEPIDKIMISYTENQKAYLEMLEKNPDIELRNGLDFNLEEFDSTKNSVLVIDDQMHNAVKNEMIQTFFTRGVHHKNISIILLTQNIFPQGKFGRDIRLNCHYIVVMKSPTFASQIIFLGRSIFPSNPSFLPDAYKKATEKPYSYIVIDQHPLSNDKFRVTQGIFEGEARFIFLPK